MIKYVCKNCGAQMELGTAGSFTCQYCGFKTFLTDADFRGNTEFRKKLLTYYKAKNDEKEMSYETDTLWESQGVDHFTALSGQRLNIDYMRKYSYPNCICYVARESIVYICETNEDADALLGGLEQLKFPEADTKLYRSFPELKTTIPLQKGKAIVFIRRPHFYPLELFVPMESVHTAWVISRLENICCALEFSGIEHSDLSMSSLFVNVKTHESALFGDWRGVSPKKSKQDLVRIREIARAATEDAAAPDLFCEFLNSKPKETAYDDFAYWDQVIQKGFGGHKFVSYD